MQELIQFENVSKCYRSGEREFKALDNISLSIPKGELVVILGPSGAGKSTLLNVLGGMDSVTSGHIYVDSQDITQYKKDSLAAYRAENVGFIFQFYNILPTLTVLENVDLMKDIVKHPKDSKDTLNSVGLSAHLNKFPSQLSGGEQQRVSIARAIVKNPKLLLCDEPTGALDSKTGVEVLRLLKQCCEEKHGGNTVIIVTHNQLIAEIADRVIHIKNGQIASSLKNEHKKEIDEVSW